MSQQEEDKRKADESTEKFKEQYTKIMEDFKKVMEEFDEKGCAGQSYKDGTEIPITSEQFLQVTTVLPSVNGKIDKIRDACESMLKLIYSFADVCTMELYELNTEMARIHIKNCDDGITITEAELDKEEAKKKVKKSSLILPGQDLILPKE